MSVITSHPTCQNGLQPICPPVRSRGNAPSYSVWIQKSHSLTDFIQCNYIIPRHHDKVTKSQDQESWLLRPLKLVWPWARSSCTDLPGSSTLSKKGFTANTLRIYVRIYLRLFADIFRMITLEKTLLTWLQSSAIHKCQARRMLKCAQTPGSFKSQLSAQSCVSNALQQLA